MTECTQRIEIQQVEICQLELRYAHARILDADAIASLVSSIVRFGQITPVTVVSHGSSLVLIDGYRRVAALKKSGHDMVNAQVRHGDETSALIQAMASNKDRKWEAVEEAVLIQELKMRFGLSLVSVATMLGRDKSWVSRRLSLLEEIGIDILDTVLKGDISTWAATRVLAPLARANQEHAMLLSESLKKEHFSTRELSEFYKHYKKGGRDQREKMVREPGLLIKSIFAKEKEEEASGIMDGGKWLKDTKVSCHVMKRLARGTETVLYPGQGNLERRAILTAVNAMKEIFRLFEENIKRRMDDIESDERNDCRDAEEGDGGSSDKSCAIPFQEHGTKGAHRSGIGEVAQKLYGDRTDSKGVILELQGQCGQDSGGA